MVALEGDALKWYQWENNRRPIRQWADLKVYILRWFRSVAGGSLYEQWLATVQTTTVMDYQRKFIETAAPLDKLPEEILLGQFLNGLRDEIKTEVRLLNPISLEHAMELAVRVEERNQVNGFKKSGGSNFRLGQYSSQSKNHVSPSVFSYGTQTSPTSIRSWASGGTESQASVNMSKYSGSSPNKGEVRRLTDKELQEKRAKGLCYRCVVMINGV